MRSAVLVGLLMACGGHSDPPPPPPAPTPATAPQGSADDPPPPAMALDDSKLLLEEQRRMRPSREREAGVPARKACTASCDLASDPRAKTECAHVAPGVLVLGFMEHISCFATEVIIDCCPAIKPDNTVAVLEALGWKQATPEQRRAIAWLYLRAVRMTSAIEAPDADFPTPAQFTPPSASLANGEVTLDFWTETVLHPRFFHHRAVFHADGTLTDTELAQLEGRRDPELARKQALETAKKAGILEAK